MSTLVPHILTKYSAIYPFAINDYKIDLQGDALKIESSR